jgi:hypothetical protein
MMTMKEFDKYTYEKLKESVAEDGTVVVATCKSGVGCLKEGIPFYVWDASWMSKDDVKIRVPFEAMNEEWKISSRYDEIEILEPEKIKDDEKMPIGVVTDAVLIDLTTGKEVLKVENLLTEVFNTRITNNNLNSGDE